LLKKGHKFGFIGASDDHRYIPGHGGALTGIYAKELTRQGLFEALKARRNFATTGSRIIIEFRVSGHFMGEEFSTQEHPRIFVHAIGETPIISLSIYRNSALIYSTTHNRKEVVLNFIDKEINRGSYFYYVRVKQRGTLQKYPHNISQARGNLGWSSPVWVNLSQ